MKDRLITITLVLVLAAAVGFIIYVHISTTRAWLQDQQLRQEGVATAVTILTLTEHNSVRGPSYCEVTFSYNVNNSVYNRTTKVSLDFCQIFSEGSQVEALYLVDEPETAELTWGGYTETQFFIMLFCDGTAILLAVVAAIAYWLNQRTNQQNSHLISQNPGFPLVITPPRGSQLMDVGCLFPFGLLVTVLMGGAMAAAIINWRKMDPGLPIVLFFSATPFFAFGLLIIYLALKDFVHSFTFTADQIQVRPILRRRQSYPATDLQDIIIEVRPLRSQRKNYALVLQFRDGRKIEMQRSSFADDDNYPPQSLCQLQTHLKQLYHL
jgi:hypothetical protein